MTKEIELTQGKVALVDDVDYAELSKYKWSANRNRNTYYAIRFIYDKKTKKYTSVFMHRQITNCPIGLQVDHANHNGLDNRKENLRVCTFLQNRQNRKLNSNNTSGFKCVNFNKEKNKYRVSMFYKNKKIEVGYFDDVIEAARAYDKKAIELYGEFACLNFPMSNDV